eukprot:2022924-Alexandrium_andersonii.AAC.1
MTPNPAGEALQGGNVSRSWVREFKLRTLAIWSQHWQMYGLWGVPRKYGLGAAQSARAAPPSTVQPLYCAGLRWTGAVPCLSLIHI